MVSPAEQKWMIAFIFIRTDFIRRTANVDREFYRNVAACLATNSTEETFLVTEGLFQANSQFLLECQSPLCDRAWSWFKQCPTQHAIQRWFVPPLRILKKKGAQGQLVCDIMTEQSMSLHAQVYT